MTDTPDERGVRPAKRSSDPGRDWATPPHNLRAIALVFAGGAIGTTARYSVTLAAPSLTFPAAVLGINIVGAFALGLLGEVLVLRVATVSARSSLRLLLGTGLLGGFTTYSTFAGDTARLIRDGHAWLGVGYAAASILVGVAAALAGIRVGGRLARGSKAGEKS